MQKERGGFLLWRGERIRMELQFDNRLESAVTVISNEFIDKYMTEANGEYMKEYLYLLRHNGETMTVVSIADALNHTEADVKRALKYWQKMGVLKAAEESAAAAVSAAAKAAPAVSAAQTKAGAAVSGAGDSPAKAAERTRCTAEDMNRLSKDTEFTQLLYIAQKYMNKTFTPMDSEVFAYLYGSLHMSAELLEYLVEYCAQNNHTNIRYIEKVALSWNEKQIRTVEEAEGYSRSFTKDSFAVMKAFGLTGRNPGEKEFEDIRRWFKEYGFTREMVTEACNRTMEAIHTPSFQYAEQILKDWKTAGIKTMGDIAAMDKERQAAKSQAAASQTAKKGKTARTSNRFHNLEEHGYDYDKMVWNMINPGGDGR